MDRRRKKYLTIVALFIILALSVIGCGIRELTPSTEKPLVTDESTKTTESIPLSQPTDTIPAESTDATTPVPPETDPPIEPSLSLGEQLRAEAEAESLDKFIRLDECTFGEWTQESSEQTRLLRDIFDRDGRRVGIEIDDSKDDDQSRLHTYSLFFSHEHADDESIVRNFYGNGTRYSIEKDWPELDAENPRRYEINYFDIYGWHTGVDLRIGDSQLSAGISYNADDPSAGFTTYTYRNESTSDGLQTIATSFRYTYEGAFLGGDIYGPGLNEHAKLAADEPPATDSWRDHWIETFEAFHHVG